MESGALNIRFPPCSAEEEPGSGSGGWQLAMKLIYKKWQGTVECHLSSVAWTRPPQLCAGGQPQTIRVPFHMCASEAPGGYKSTHMRGPKQLWSPSLILFHRVPCIFVSIPSHVVSSATSAIFWWWLYLELHRAIPATLLLPLPQKGICLVLFRQAHLVILPRTAQCWVAWLATRLGDQEQWGQCYSWHICCGDCASRPHISTWFV